MTAERHASVPALTILALAPLWIVVLSLWQGWIQSAMSSNEVNVAGLPAGSVRLLIPLALTLAGVIAVRSWRRPWLALLVLTLPAALLVLYLPALVLALVVLGQS